MKLTSVFCCCMNMEICLTVVTELNALRLRQNGRHITDFYKCIFFKENVWILIKISLRFVSKGPVNNTAALVQIMAWHLSGDKPLSEPMIVSLLRHLCITRPQWIKDLFIICSVSRDLEFFNPYLTCASAAELCWLRYEEYDLQYVFRYYLTDC